MWLVDFAKSYTNTNHSHYGNKSRLIKLQEYRVSVIMLFCYVIVLYNYFASYVLHKKFGQLHHMIGFIFTSNHNSFELKSPFFFFNLNIFGCYFNFPLCHNGKYWLNHHRRIFVNPFQLLGINNGLSVLKKNNLINAMVLYLFFFFFFIKGL